MITYEDFFTPTEVSIFKRVKLGQMDLARVAREVAAEMVDAPVPLRGRRGRAYLRSSQGAFRMSMGDNSDNTTEVQAHEDAGAIPVVMGDPKQMGHFFEMHGVIPGDLAYQSFMTEVKRRL